jgi:ABC-2 type transport system permease protein
MARPISGRLKAMIVKEFWAVLRDPRGRIILFVPPLLQLILFSAAATLEIKNLSVAVLDRDGGAASTEFVSQIAGSPNVTRLVTLTSEQDLAQAINRQRVVAAIVIPARFSADVASGRGGTVQMILDGRRSNAAQIVATYVGRIAASAGTTLRATTRAPPLPEVIATNWFNPNLDYLWFMMPVLVVQVGAISALSVSAQSVARERELGTFDQLLVSPLRTWEMITGKLVPPFAIGMINGTIYLIVIPLIFGVPFRGSVLLFYAALAAGLFAVLGIGLLVSTIARTQQQAFLGMFAVMPPMLLISGFASPVDNMPLWLRIVAQADPLKHMNVIMEGLFLKAMPADDVFANLWPMLVIGAVTMGIAVQQFRARME